MPALPCALRLLSSLALVAAAGVLPMTATAAVPDPLPTRTRFYTPPANPGAKTHLSDLEAAGRTEDAALVKRMLSLPQAVWMTTGKPGTVERAVRTVMSEADRQSAVATLVLYNVPGRDCSLYSAGGAAGDAAYRDWIDGVARGLAGTRRVVVVVEPDGLALLPSDCPDAYPGADLAALSESRIANIRYAGTTVSRANPNALVYLDAGSSAWHAVGDIASRLDRAGVRGFQGFSLNVSNFQPMPRLLQYGSWVSKCLHYANNPAEGGWRMGHYEHCASQYHPASYEDHSTWTRTDEWYAAQVDAAPGAPTSARELTHFVVDTSRNGRGPWQPSTSYPDAQDWCNPPGRGLGQRATPRPGPPLVDAYLWIKAPGESDGQCNRGVDGSTTDPEWGGVADPPAGSWFRAQALELARLSDPPLL